MKIKLVHENKKTKKTEKYLQVLLGSLRELGLLSEIYKT